MGAFLPQKNKVKPLVPSVKATHCAIYTRKSTDENMDGYNSLHAQRDACLAFIQSREGIGWQPYQAEYDDPGFSGKNMERPALSRLVADAKKGRFSVVVCYKYDRLSRNTRDFLYLLDLFDKHGVSFVSITQNIDTSTSSGRLLRQILVDFGQFEREMISERTRDKMAAMAAKGKWLGSNPRLGYDYNPSIKKLEVNEKEAAQVRDIFDTYSSKKSLLYAAQAINQKGYRMKSWFSQNSKRQKGGALFNKANLQSLLTNPLYIGKIHYKQQLYDGEHRAIMDESNFYQVQEIMYGNRNAVMHRTNKDVGYDYLLKGLLKCWSCGYKMSPNYAYSKGRKYFYYKCVPVMKSGPSACKVKSVPARQIDDFVAGRLSELAKHPEILAEIVQKARSRSGDIIPEKKKELSELNLELGKVIQEAESLVKMTGKEEANAPRAIFFKMELDKLAKQREELTAKAFTVQAEIQRYENHTFNAEVIQNNISQLHDIFKLLDSKSRHEVLELIIDDVIYNGETRQVTINFFVLPLLDRELWARHEAVLNSVKSGVTDGT